VRWRAHPRPFEDCPFQEVVLSMLRLAVLAVIMLVSPFQAQARTNAHVVPMWFWPQVLCVHSGRHYAIAQTAAERRLAEYWPLPGLGLVATTRVGWGERSDWHGFDSLYGGGLEFDLSTWRAAGGRGVSTADIATASIREQVYRAWVIVRTRGSWGDWPNTAAACGLR
jgi:hypothetical protein